MPHSRKILPLVEVDGNGHAGRAMTPLQAELLAAGIPPDSDELGHSMTRGGIAPAAGYGEAGPGDLPGPAATEAADAWPPVLQWEIDPSNQSLTSGESNVRLDDWDFAVWWQQHPAGLLYVAIQALQEHRAAEGERQPPLGRNVAVNLVYDQEREAVLAIYGTARDFRPFVTAFRLGLGLEPSSEEPPHAATR